MLRHGLPTELPNERVMSTVDIPALRHEIAVLQELCAVFFQEPLDRCRACLMRADVDIADAFCHLRALVGGRPAPAILTARYDSVRNSFR
jgi:hypothetical protein